jgi:hypothetical protein
LRRWVGAIDLTRQAPAAVMNGAPNGAASQQSVAHFAQLRVDIRR